MIERALKDPKRSYFLFGSRGTGKSTWLRKTYPNALWFNLLRTSELLSLQQDLQFFRKQVEALPPGSWVVIDEVQKFPQILDEVHDVIATHGAKKYQFVLSGSSARKLKKAGVNLLAGRAVSRYCFPITIHELQKSKIKLNLEDLLKFGSLPALFSEESDLDKMDYLESYVDTYIKEEIKEEALVRKLEPFARFLKIAAINQGQILNIGGVSREVAKGRGTVEGYYEVLEDTLIGVRIPAHQPRMKTKEISHPKFYLFDTGVTRVLSQRHRNELDRLERSFLFETLVLNELRVWNAYHQQGYEIKYWGSPSGGEIDFLLCHGEIIKVAIEVKSTDRYRSEFSKYLKELRSKDSKIKAFVVLEETKPMNDNGVEVFRFFELNEKLMGLLSR